MPIDYTLEYLETPTTNIITAEKCSARYANDDADCLGTPYESIYDIVFLVTVDNDPTTLNTDLQFTVQIGNICVNDEISFAPTSLLLYQLKDPVVSTTITPTV